MTTTTSKVDRGNDEANALLRKWCDLAAGSGGSFSITSHYQTGSCWFNTYVINWPKGEQARQQDGTTDSAKTTTDASAQEVGK